MLLHLFEERLVATDRVDDEMRQLADRHYSRRRIGYREFVGPGRALVLRNVEGTILFAWRSTLYRLDDQVGYECTIFRNESDQLSSDVILEAEQRVFDAWGRDRLFTYVDPRKVRSRNPGYCFKMAGWRFVRLSKDQGLHLLTKP